MAELKRRGDLAELMVAADLARQGFRLLLPYGEDFPYDLVIERGGRFERVQVKHTLARHGAIAVSCRTQSLTNGRVRTTRRYTITDIDWLAAYEPVSGSCFYIPAAELGPGRAVITLRLDAAKNNQRAGVRPAASYARLPPVP